MTTTYKTNVKKVMRSKAFQASFQAVSKTGECEVDTRSITSTSWITLPVPVADDQEPLVTDIARKFARIAQALGGLPADEAANAMLEIREDLFMTWAGHELWFYLGPPRHRPLPVMLGVWEMDGERDEQLRFLAGAETVDLVEPPVVEPFPTEHLGAGVKVQCVQRSSGRRNSVVGLLGYAWRSQDLETDLHIKAMCPDLGWLQGAMSGIDEFARALRVVPKQS